jgi:two-component system, NtrC family, nitrogen regulation sensor histidine kinase NtrY
MISRNIYLNTVTRVFILVLLSVLMGYLIHSENSIRFILVSLLFVILTTSSLVHYLNTTNRNIRFFFDSVKNDDSSLSFPTDSKNSTISELYASMNRVNQQIKDLKLENRSQEQFFQVLLEHIATGIVTYDEKGHVMHANSAAKRLLSTEVLTHLKQIEGVDHKLYYALKFIRPSERRLVSLKTLNGELQLALKAASFRTGNRSLMLLSIEDIKNELDEKELESWMKLIRVLTHEIMNSITPITSLSETLSDFFIREGQPVQPDGISEKTISTTIQGLNVIREQGKGLKSFVESYRQLTRIPEPDRKPFPVRELLERINVLFSSMSPEKKINITITQKDPELQLYADQNMISQVLVNLLKNALESNEDNSDVKIFITASGTTEGRPEICITDNGPGIPAEHIDEIFVPFFTTRKNGSGIGLSISKQIMRMHGGNLKARSVPGVETTFCMTF